MITRERVTIHTLEKSVIDLVPLSSDLAESMEKIVIDEAKNMLWKVLLNLRKELQPKQVTTTQ